MNTDSERTTDTRRRNAKRSWLLALAVAFAIPAACAPEADDTVEGDFDTGEQMAETSREAERPAGERPMAERGDDAAMAEAEGETTVQLTIRQSDQYGAFVVRGEGTPLYLFTADTRGEASACYDACADAWPPVTGFATAGANLDADLLGTITRRDGSVQATYNGWPLYEFARDSGSQPTGQDMEGFGGEWYLVSPEGEEVHAGSESETH